MRFSPETNARNARNETRNPRPKQTRPFPRSSFRFHWLFALRPPSGSPLPMDDVRAVFNTTASTTQTSAPSTTPRSPCSSSPSEPAQGSQPPVGWRSKNYNRHRHIRMMARKRAQQRWSALLSRIAKQVRLEGRVRGARQRALQGRLRRGVQQAHAQVRRSELRRSVRSSVWRFRRGETRARGERCGEHRERL